jgi:hypothetical protein
VAFNFVGDETSTQAESKPRGAEWSQQSLVAIGFPFDRKEEGGNNNNNGNKRN